ncbi:2OG-Fe(II) oxygenase [Streptomyces sp. NPDC048514]|uniref:2OG-Fe(II) oxygenase n=1 Tax=Streptomyces sp. NPDC048514 TaxID=3365564 RepID=UPI0037214C56
MPSSTAAIRPDWHQQAEGVFTSDSVPASLTRRMLDTIRESSLWSPAPFGLKARQSVDTGRRVQQHIPHTRMSDEMLALAEPVTNEVQRAGERLLTAGRPSELCVLEYQHTRSGDSFPWHRDSSPERARCFTMVLYLPYGGLAGGATQFQLAETGRPDFEVAAREGRVMLFRSDLRHRGETVAAGDKYALVANFRLAD